MAPFYEAAGTLGGNKHPTFGRLIYDVTDSLYRAGVSTGAEDTTGKVGTILAWVTTNVGLESTVGRWSVSRSAA